MPIAEERTGARIVPETRQKAVWEQFCKAFLAAWGDTIKDDESYEEEEDVVGLGRSESDSDDEPLDSLAQLKEKVCGLNKAKV